MINDVTRPLVIVGTNSAIWHHVDMFKDVGYNIAGIIDDDYHGEGHFQDLPVIARESDIVGSKALRECQFVCATSWQPPEAAYPGIHERNRAKRDRLISYLEAADLHIATVVHPLAHVSTRNVFMGRGVIVHPHAWIMQDCKVQSWSELKAYSCLGHHSAMGRNSILHRMAQTAGHANIGDDVYLGPHSQLGRDHVHVASGTFLHPTLVLMRDTQPNEVVSLAGRDLRRVYTPTQVD